MGRKDNREQIAIEITKELEKATGITWEPKICIGTGTIEYMVEQYNIYFMFNVYNYEDMPRSVSIEKHSPVNISIDELYNVLIEFVFVSILYILGLKKIDKYIILWI